MSPQLPAAWRPWPDRGGPSRGPGGSWCCPATGDSRKLRLPLSSLGQRKGKGTDETGRLPVACLALPPDVTCHGEQEGPGGPLH